ncbi:MAG: transcription termination factor Rho [Lachnospiraceae bacterium]|nr:transcription termination factor Rho [Lachnospiraceae bacterium]
MREKYELMSVAALKELAKSRGLKGLSGMKKSDLVDVLVSEDAKNSQAGEEKVTGQTPSETAVQADIPQKNTKEDQTGAVVSERKEAASDRVQPSGYREEQQGVYQTAPVRNSEDTAPRQKNIIRTPDRRETGVNRPRREGTYTSYARREGSVQVRREASVVADRRESYGTGESRDNTAFIERRTYSQENDRREVQQTERPETAAAGERTDAGTDKPPVDLAQLDSGISVGGILEVMPDGYGFIRSDNYLPGENDVYVSPSQIRKFNLKTGDIITGNTRIKSQQEKFSALLYLKTINNMIPSEAMKRYNFEDMTPVFPNERMRMERGSRAIAMRIVDLFSPIGKGQRGMIVSPPKAGKTTLLKDVAKSILQNDPKMRLLILLIDERPEEVTDIKEAIRGENVEVIYSTFDELPEHHKRVSEMVIERAKRLVEHNENVTILLDSITRLARAYNLTVPPSGRTLSGGLDPAALHMPKRFFGAARNMREGGSLTILATALVDTGSKMDDVVYEEFKGTGNMELVLDRKLSEKRVFPAIDIPKSGTRRDDLLLDRDEQEAMEIMRRALNGMKSDEAVENILNMFVHTRDNHELVQKVRRQKFI